MVVDGVDEPDPHVSVVVRHQHDVEQLLALRVQVPQTSVHGLQRLSKATVSDALLSGSAD